MAPKQSNTLAVGTNGASDASNTVAGTSTPATQTKPAKGFRLQLQQMLTGLQTALPSDSKLVAPAGSNVGTLAVTTLIQQMQAGLAEFSAVDAAELTLAHARVALGADLPGLHAQYDALKLALEFFFGRQSPELAQFGLKPKRKAAPLSPEAQLMATAKRLQTRAIRHTAGSKQKAAMKFTGQVVVATQVNAPSVHPAPTAAPATPAAAGPTGSNA